MVRPRDRDPALRRRSPSREPKHRILIVCEGEKTEPFYFRELQHDFRNRLVHIEISNEHGVPLTVVQKAIEERDNAAREAKAARDENLSFDETWCVFDVDEHPNLDQALELARKSNLQVALSNPCFELWGLLHFQDQLHSIHRHDAQRALAGFLRTNETKRLPLAKMQATYTTAVARAKELHRLAQASRAPWRNPTTNVFELTERIRQGA